LDSSPTQNPAAADRPEVDHVRRPKEYAVESKLIVAGLVASSRALIARSKANLESCRAIYP
jgi:hypothetical protein